MEIRFMSLSSRRRWSAPFEPDSLARFESPAMDLVCRSQVLERDAQRFVDRDVVSGLAARRLAEQDLAQLAEQVAVRDRSLLARDQELARFVHARLLAIG